MRKPECASISSSSLIDYATCLLACDSCRIRHDRRGDAPTDARNSNGFVSSRHDVDARHTSQVYGDRDLRHPSRGYMRSSRDDWDERGGYVAYRESKRRRSNDMDRQHYRAAHTDDRRGSRTEHVYGDRHTDRQYSRQRAVDPVRYSLFLSCICCCFTHMTSCGPTRFYKQCEMCKLLPHTFAVNSQAVWHQTTMSPTCLRDSYA